MLCLHRDRQGQGRDGGRPRLREAGRAAGEQFDLVILDAFNGEYIPEHLMAREFLEEVKALLSPHGILVANTFSSSRLYDAESATYSKVFGRFYNIRRSGTGNRVIVASMQPLPGKETLAQRARTLQSRLERFGMDASEYPPLMDAGQDWSRKARILTDQYAPVNLLNN
ncbi:spermidine synthase [Kineobactrum salinum]|uniref:spermidine synthase n=1 Tax=Kineobactrum salinum TaxID=2708301 RepID=UPI0022B296A3|nr:fused MFS/spermidine synthase [Kineobactrum salinum]